MKNGFLVVERLNQENSYYFKSGRNPIFPFSHERILQKHMGFEGKPWPEEYNEYFSLEGGLVPFDKYEKVREYFELVSQKYRVDILYIQVLPSVKNNIEKPNIPSFLKFCGYDYGIYDSEYNFYSILYHEVLYGLHEDLRKYAALLNEDILFSRIFDVEKLSMTRKIIAKTAQDLETFEEGEELTPISIYTIKK